jgi:hypothetical protein
MSKTPEQHSHPDYAYEYQYHPPLWVYETGLNKETIEERRSRQQKKEN